jgi:beta-lactamase class A
MPELSRRVVVAGLAASAGWPGTARGPMPDARLGAIERAASGRLGVCAIDAAGRVIAAHRAAEPFLMCSTFKAFLAGAVLERVDLGRERLDRAVPVAPGDIVFHSPAVERALPSGAMTVSSLCEAAVVLSDNAAANLLLGPIGGPSGLTRYFRTLGGSSARLDRLEPALNRADGAKDTSSAADAARMLCTLLAPGRLSKTSRASLEGWMIASPTGRARLRAGLPAGWRAGDKTGTGPEGETNDIAFVDVPRRGRVVIATYYRASNAALDAREPVLAEVAREVAAALG